MYSHDNSATVTSYPGSSSGRTCKWSIARTNDDFDVTMIVPTFDAAANRPGIYWPSNYEGNIADTLANYADENTYIGDYLKITTK